MRVYVHLEEEEPSYTAALTAGCDSFCHTLSNSTSLLPVMLGWDAKEHPDCCSSHLVLDMQGA
jgi:hypothetical protein